jgi:hypothetical protein
MDLRPEIEEETAGEEDEQLDGLQKIEGAFYNRGRVLSGY